MSTVSSYQDIEHLEKKSAPKQFNFSRHWKSKIAQHLSDRRVELSLTLGMRLLDPNYKRGDPPWLVGRGILNGQRARERCLSWYQPWGRCHHIAPFSWALGRLVFPNLQWGFAAGEHHTVAIGVEDDWNYPVIVMDILLFKQMSASESLSFAQTKDYLLCPSLASYLQVFYNDSGGSSESVIAICEKIEKSLWKE